MFRRKKKTSEIRGGTGCAYVMGVGLIIISLLLINGMFVSAFVRSNNFSLAINQTLQFIMPIVLIILEFWIYDRITQNWHHRKQA